MRIQIKNCVTDPKFKELRRAGSPVFKPVILGNQLVPGAVRVVESSSFGLNDVTFLCSLVKSGSCLATEVGVGPVDFESWLSTFEESVEISAPEPEVDPDDDTQSMDIEEQVVTEQAEELSEEEEPSAEIEEIIEEEPTIYTESELLSMTNSDLRDIAYGLDPEAAVSNKSKKKLVALIEELQNESSST